MQDELGHGTGSEARIAGAPISWGVCEVPGWGHQLTPDRVLTEMRSLGLGATEFGPAGFLADEPEAKARQLASHGLTAVGGFLPIVLHDPSHDPLPDADWFIESCLAAGAEVMVLAAATGVVGYDGRPGLDELGWKTMMSSLDRIADHARQRGITAALHPHVGTLVETGDEIDRLMRDSRVGLCVDTGHLAVGGADPVAITATYADRVNHVHLKDVDMALAGQVVSGALAFGAAVKAGMFRPLGQGDVDVAALVSTLEAAGYSGWYVLEQDVVLDLAPEGAGPVENVRISLDYLLGVLR
jgi:inosose dehydratase